MTSGSLLAASSAVSAVGGEQHLSHGLSSGWSRPLVGLHAVSDVLAIAAFCSIPLVLLLLWRRRRTELPFPRLFVAFALFVLGCGATHLVELWNLWHADYWLAGSVKALAAAAAVVTAVMLARLLPTLSRLPSPAELEKINADLAAANASLLASEETFRAFMDNSPVTAWVVDEAGTFRFFNQALTRQLGDLPLALGKTLRDVFPPQLADEYEASNRIVLQSGRPRELENRTPSGLSQILLFPLMTTDGRRLVGGVGIDVTERHRLHATLQEQGELLASVTEALRVYLEKGDWKTAHGLLLRCALRQTGGDRGFIGAILEGPRLRVLAHEGMPWEELLGRPAFEQAMRPLAEHGYLELTRFEKLFGVVVTGGGVIIPNTAPGAPEDAAAPGGPAGNYLVVPVLHEQQTVGLLGIGLPAGAMDSADRLETIVNQAGVLCDSYRRHLREASLEEQVRVSHKMEAVGLLAGGVAHDFNNLLQVIHGYTSLALDPAAPWPERRASLDQVKAAADRATQLTQQLLAFGRKQTLQKSDLDLNQSLSDLLRMLRRLLGEQITVDFIPGHELGNVHADRAQIDQVLLNLCLNARDALPDGGRITIETENVLVNGAFRESHPWARPGRYVLIAVSDNGVGMDKETLTHVFEPFFTTKPKGKGTGLGLSVVYGVVKQHDGMVHVYSEPGKGTTFKIYLPIVARAATAVGPKHVAPPARGSETILLAEDEPMVRELAFRILSRAGYKVIAAADGVAACATFAAHHDEIALLILDVVMPHLGGREVYERIAAQRPGIPVIFCSGYAGSALAADALHAPGTHLLAKPYGADEMLQRVRSVLDRR